MIYAFGSTFGFNVEDHSSSFSPGIREWCSLGLTEPECNCKGYLQDRASQCSFSTSSHLAKRMLPNTVLRTQNVKFEKSNGFPGCH